MITSLNKGDIVEFPNLLTKRISRLLAQKRSNAVCYSYYALGKVNGRWNWISLRIFKAWYLEYYACPILDRCKYMHNMYEVAKYLSNKKFKVAETFTRHLWAFNKDDVREGVRTVQMPYLIKYHK